MKIRTLLGLVALSITVSVTGCAPQKAAGVDAEEAFATGADRAPTAKSLYGMSRVLAGQGRDDEARYVLQRIIREQPEFVPAYTELAELHMRQNRVNDAIEVLNAGVTVAPQDPVLINNLGMCAMMKGEHAKALDHFTKAAALAPGNARHLGNVGAALGMLGRYDEAVAVYEQIMPPAEAHFNVGVLAEARGDSARAQAEFSTSNALDPNLMARK